MRNTELRDLRSNLENMLFDATGEREEKITRIISKIDDRIGMSTEDEDSVIDFYKEEPEPDNELAEEESYSTMSYSGDFDDEENYY